MVATSTTHDTSTASERPPDFDGGRPMTILEHLQELRGRLIWCCIALVVGVALSFMFTKDVLEFMKEPMTEKAPQAELIFRKPLEGFTTYVKISLYLGVIMAMPVFVYQTLMFVLPGLTPQEKKWVLPIVFGIFVSFLGGMSFAYFITLPPALKFLLNFNTDIAKPQIDLSEYISFVTRLVFWVGITFETPLFILALARFGIVTGRKLLGWWRYVIVIVFLVAAFVTPTPDPVTQTLVAGPLLVLYLLGVVLAFLFGRDRPQTAGGTG